MWHEAPAWSWTWLWQWTNGFTKAVIFLLLIMFVHACVVYVERIWRFKDATKQLAALDSAAIAGTAGRAGVFANLIDAGFVAFQSAPSCCSRFQAGEYARRAMGRCGFLAHAEMRTGVTTVATIAALAPFVGLAGNVVGLLDSFRGGSNTPTGWLVLYASSIALSLVPTALGILVGVVAVWFYNHLIRRMEIFDVQTAKAAAVVISYLENASDQRAYEAPSNLLSTPLFSGSPPDWEVRFDALRVLLGSVWFVWLYVVATIAWACFGI